MTDVSCPPYCTDLDGWNEHQKDSKQSWHKEKNVYFFLNNEKVLSTSVITRTAMYFMMEKRTQKVDLGIGWIRGHRETQSRFSATSVVSRHVLKDASASHVFKSNLYITN